MSRSERYHYVDLLRGLAALAVLIAHWRAFYQPTPGAIVSDAALPGYSILWPFWTYGEVAVPLFWVLSGFVFALAYGQYGKGLSIRDFWFRRFARLYPLHFATLLIVAGLQAISLATFGHWQVWGNNDLPHFIEHLFLASNWFTMTPSFNAPIWSVSIEEVVYILFLLYLKRLGLSLRGALLLGLLGFAVERLTHNKIAMCTALFFAGVGIAILRGYIRGAFIGAVGLVILAALTVAVIGAHQARHLLPLFVYFGTPAVLVFFIGLDRRSRPLPERFHWFGLSTYSIYLLHMPVLMALKMTVGIVSLPIYAAIVLALAYPSYRWFERPMQNGLRAWSGGTNPKKRGDAAKSVHQKTADFRRW